MPKAKTAQSRAETTEQLAPSGAGNKENSLLQFDVRIQSIRPGESIKGTASVNINGAFAIRGVKIIEGSNGLFVSMPSYKVGNEYKDICFPITQECPKMKWMRDKQTGKTYRKCHCDNPCTTSSCGRMIYIYLIPRKISASILV